MKARRVRVGYEKERRRASWSEPAKREVGKDNLRNISLVIELTDVRRLTRGVVEFSDAVLDAYGLRVRDEIEMCEARYFMDIPVHGAPVENGDTVCRFHIEWAKMVNNGDFRRRLQWDIDRSIVVLMGEVKSGQNKQSQVMLTSTKMRMLIPSSSTSAFTVGSTLTIDVTFLPRPRFVGLPVARTATFRVLDLDPEAEEASAQEYN